MTKCARRIFAEVSKGGGRKTSGNPRSDRPDRCERVLYGGLFPQSIRLLCDTYGLSVKSKKIEFEDFSKYYSKAVIATDLPGYELIDPPSFAAEERVS